MEEISAGQAAERLGKTAQTVRDWARTGKLKGRQTDAGRWWIDEQSIADLVRSDAPHLRVGVATDGVRSALDDIVTMMAEMKERDRASERLLRAVQSDRDRFRAEAATFRAAALELVTAARETDAGVRHLLAVLDRQGEALAQILAPGSPQDLELTPLDHTGLDQ